MSHSPEKIRALRAEGVLEIRWSPEVCLRYPFWFLRGECPCAACVNEFTGERTLDPDTIPKDIVPSAMEFSGNYALKIQWSDGHATGLYSWELLHRLASAPQVMPCEAVG
jgi:DUF971 family protein